MYEHLMLERNVNRLVDLVIERGTDKLVENEALARRERMLPKHDIGQISSKKNAVISRLKIQLHVSLQNKLLLHLPQNQLMTFNLLKLKNLLLT